MAQAVIFDLDGVLIESEPYFMAAEVEILNKHGMPLTEEVISHYLGLKLDDFLAALEKYYKTTIDHQQVMAELHERIEYLYEHEIPLVEHAKAVLQKLRSHYKLGLATSREKRLAQTIMRRHGILDYFEAGIYREDVRHGKPNPEVFLLAAKALGVKPADCVVVEDARNGFKAAKSAGMFVIGRQCGHNLKQDFADANVTVKDLSRIPALIAKHVVK